MKKIASLLLICILTLSLIGCTKEEEYEKPVDILTKTWDSYKKNEKFHVVGGDFDYLPPHTRDFSRELGVYSIFQL